MSNLLNLFDELESNNPPREGHRYLRTNFPEPEVVTLYQFETLADLASFDLDKATLVETRPMTEKELELLAKVQEEEAQEEADESKS